VTTPKSACSAPWDEGRPGANQALADASLPGITVISNRLIGRVAI
jgi:hypothetical protein